MNPFQRARDVANEQRERLLGSQKDEALDAPGILAYIEEKLNLAVEKVPPNFSELGGGSAVLKREENYIYVRRDLSSDEHCYLVAHELGHWFLDVEKSHMTISHIRALSESEGSPATITVESYGARERQELIANVFARELLLPREVAKRLWNDGNGAKAIARKLSIPLECVRLQLLDALLLPDTEELIAKKLHSPSPDQKNAAEAKERFVNVVAGPGTGKTSTLVHRVKYLIEVLRVNPSEILVLTFTNKAAFELIERLKDGGIAKASDIWAGTFHAFGLEFLRKYHHYFELDANVSVADKLNVLSFLVKALPQLNLKHYLRVEDPYDWLGPVIQAIKRLKEELVSPEEYRARLGKLPSVDPALGLRREDVATLYEAHERILKDLKIVDFVDLVSKPALALKNERAKFPEIESKFQYVLVDEYQDVTYAMVELVRQLAHNAKSVWVVGDVRQAIHHWRGASVKSLMRFEQTFKSESLNSIKKYPLEINRRSSTEIVNLITQVGKIHTLEPHLALDIVSSSNGDSGEIPSLVSCVGRELIPNAIVKGISKSLALGIRLREQAVLCRYSADLETVAENLRVSGVSTLYVGELAQRPEIKKLLCLMQILCERHPRALVGLCNELEFSLSRVDIDTLVVHTTENPNIQRGRWLGHELTGLTLSGRAALRNLRVHLEGFTRSSSPWDFVCDILLEHRFGLPAPADTSIESAVKRIALWQFSYSVRNGDGDRREARLSRYLMRQRLRQRIGETYSDRELPPEAMSLDAVRLLTVHASKGLEYEAIHLGYINSDTYGSHKPNWTSGESITELVPAEVLNSSQEEYDFETAIERNNLFYVALSRAKKHLFMYEDIRFENRPQQLSHFPMRYRKFNFDIVSPVSPVAVSKSPHALVSRPQLKYEEFDTFTRCALQYHYKHELLLNAELDPDSALRARWAIMETLKAFSQDSAMSVKGRFLEEWTRYRLPDEAEDVGLWLDSNKVLDSGISIIKSLGGNYLAPQLSTVAGLDIHLPWLIVTHTPYSQTLHLIRFSSSGMTNAITLLRPMLSGLAGGGNKTIVIHSLLSAQLGEVKPSAAVMQTKTAKAAIRLLAGDRSPAKGSHCRRCSYMTFCPTKPRA